MDARHILVEPYGIGVGDEVDLVAARGQFQAQLRGDDAAAAVGGITGDTNSHFCSVALTGRGVAYAICPRCSLPPTGFAGQRGVEHVAGLMSGEGSPPVAGGM